MRPNVTDKDKLYLLRTTSSPEVRSFLDRQPVNTKTDYQRLRKALIKEFADPESDQGLVAALETRQGRHDTPQAYYSRLRQAYFGTRNDSDMEDELNFKTLFLRNLHPGISHHLGVLACPRTMNTQQLRDLVQKAYYKQKMASEKSTKTPAVLDFNTQHHELALEGTQRQDSAKPPHRKWNAPPSNRERYSHADTRPKQRYDRWDGPRGRQRSPGRHWDKSGDRSWNQPSSYGNSKGKRQTHPGAVSPRNRRKKSPRFQADRVQTESTQEQETPPHFDSQKLMEMMVKEFFQRKEEDRKWEKKDEPESAWLAVRRNGSDKLNKSAPENSTASPCSQRTVNTLTSDGHETPPENPATELNTNSTPNTPNHSSVQQTPADETPSSWKCCLSHLPFLRRTPDQVWHPKRFLPNSSPSNDQNDALTTAGASHEESWTFHALPPNPTVAAVTRRQHATGEHTPALLHYHTTSVRCWRSPHPHMRIRHYEPWQLTCQNHVTHPPSSASSTLSTTCCICKTVSTHMSLSHSLRHSS